MRTTINHKPTRKLLDQGGEVFINKMGKRWTIDVWAAEQKVTDDPIYHQFYADELDARADFDSWVAWPEDERG